MDAAEAAIGAIYDAVGDDEAFAALKDVLVDHLGAYSGWAVHANDVDQATQQAMDLLDPTIRSPYKAYYQARDPWLHAALAAPQGKVLLLDQYVPPKVWGASEIYNELARPNGDYFHCLALWGELPGGGIWSIGLHRARSQGEYRQDERERAEQLAPHLRRMAQARWRVSKALERAAAPAQVLEDNPDAMFLLDRTGVVAWRNAAAGRLTEPGSLFALDGASVLQLRRPDAQARFLAARLRAAGRSGPALGGAFSAPEATCVIAVDPAPGGEGRVIVTVRNLRAYKRRRADAAARRFGLTASETALVESLLNGLSVEQHAELRGVSVETARSQMRAVRLKSGYSRQGELLIALLEGPELSA